MATILHMYSLLFILSITPGPNNILLASTGMNHGYIASKGHMFGIWVGLFLMHTLAFWGVNFISQNIFLQAVLNVCGYIFLTYLGVKIIMNARKDFTNSDGERKVLPPLTFTQAFMMQWVNTKAISTAVTIASIGVTVLPYHWYILIFILNCIFATHVWILLGKSLEMLLKSERQRYIVNTALGGLLLITAMMMLNFDIINEAYANFFQAF